MRLLVVDEVAFEGCHLRLVEERAVGTTPEIEEIVDGVVALLGGRVGLESRADEHTDVI